MLCTVTMSRKERLELASWRRMAHRFISIPSTPLRIGADIDSYQTDMRQGCGLRTGADIDSYQTGMRQGCRVRTGADIDSYQTGMRQGCRLRIGADIDSYQTGMRQGCRVRTGADIDSYQTGMRQGCDGKKVREMQICPCDQRQNLYTYSRESKKKQNIKK